jgi:SRSO17 transposase
VKTLAEQLARRRRRWQRYRLLEGAKKTRRRRDVVALRALASRTGVREGIPGPEVWLLIRRPLPLPVQTTPPELNYSLSTAPADLPLAELMRVCGLRWPMECCFEEGTGEVGMDHDELRFWRGWQHHMTLVILAQHLLVRLRQRLMDRSDRASTPTATATAPHLVEPPARERGGERVGLHRRQHRRQQRRRLRRCPRECPGSHWFACR